MVCDPERIRMKTKRNSFQEPRKAKLATSARGGSDA